MSTAPLKFQAPEHGSQLDPDILEAAWDAFPGPLAIMQDEQVLYANRPFREFSSFSRPAITHSESNSNWEVSHFNVGQARLALHVFRHGASTPESQYLNLAGRLVSSVAHDFNNLLTGILLYCDLLSTKSVAPAQFAEKIEEIRSAAEKGAGLIRQLMTVGREDADSPHVVSFVRAVLDVLPLLRRLVGENVKIETKFSVENELVPITLAQAQQILLNLVLNARDAMPDGGTIAIETNSSQHGCAKPAFKLVVGDSGSGMDEKTAARMFEPFFTTKTHGRGTGMGLATVRRIVESAGGSIEVDTAPGRGTRVMVRLPEIQPQDDKIQKNAVGEAPGSRYSEIEGGYL